MNVETALSDAPYPGRGLIIFRTEGEGLCAVYWLTGRSAASRSRLLVGDGPNLVVTNLLGVANDPLRHYRAARRDGLQHIVGNGDHVDTLAAELNDGAAPFDALRTLNPEPDPPLFTARIAAIVGGDTDHVFVGAARSVPLASHTDHIAINAERIDPEQGILIATYSGDPESPTVWAIPLWIDTAPTLPKQLRAAWGALNPSFRVAIAGRALSHSGSWIQP